MRRRSQGSTLCYRVQRQKLDKPRSVKFPGRSKPAVFKYKTKVNFITEAKADKKPKSKLTKTALREKTVDQLKSMLRYRGIRMSEMADMNKTELIDTLINIADGS